MIEVVQTTQPERLRQLFAIREEVFVREQQVPLEEEYDEFEMLSRHFLAYFDGVPCGTARWRATSGGLKLERLAVLKSFRGKGVGKTLIRAVLDDIFGQQPGPIESIYLHAQLSAMPLYTSFGFQVVGELFEECGIQHYKMILPVSLYPS